MRKRIFLVPYITLLSLWPFGSGESVNIGARDEGFEFDIDSASKGFWTNRIEETLGGSEEASVRHASTSLDKAMQRDHPICILYSFRCITPRNRRINWPIMTLRRQHGQFGKRLDPKKPAHYDIPLTSRLIFLIL
jgi:hypothetical protein